MKTLFAAAATALALISTPAAAEIWEPKIVHVDRGENDVGFGIGLTWNLGGGSVKAGPSIGIKAFSQRRPQSVAASAGVDFNLSSMSLRPNFGVAYLFNRSYLDLNYGYDFGSSSWGLGLTGGYTETAQDSRYIKYPDYH